MELSPAPSRFQSLWFLPILLLAAWLLLHPGRAHIWLPPCPFHTLTGLDCPGCGSTRALRALLQGHWIQAFDYNLLFLPALLACVAGGLQNFGVLFRRLWQGLNRPWLVLLVVLAFGILRNLPWAPFLWLSAGH